MMINKIKSEKELNADCSDLIFWFQKIEKGDLNKEILHFFWGRLIWNAIKWKYDDVDESVVQSYVRDENLEQLNISDKSAKDIHSQLRTLQMIENKWIHESFDREMVFDIYSQLSGISKKKIHLRNNIFTTSTGFTTPVLPESIDRELQSFFDLLESSHIETMNGDLTLRIEKAVTVFAKLIWIHPFPDKNGRVARMSTNCLLRKWHLPYIPIPKVRNSPDWMESLKHAMDGRTERACSLFRKWIYSILAETKKLFIKI